MSERQNEGKVRINVNIPRDTYNQLAELANVADISMSEFVRNAIRVYYAIKQETNQRKHVYIGDKDRIEKELVIP